MKRSEAHEQSAVFAWADMQSKVPGWEWLNAAFHVPNGGSRNKIEATNLKRQGVKSGVPDIAIAAARSGYNSLFIEMKHGNNRVTANQKVWIDRLRALGNAVAVCYSAEEAINVIRSYGKGELGPYRKEMAGYGKNEGRRGNGTPQQNY